MRPRNPIRPQRQLINPLILNVIRSVDPYDGSEEGPRAEGAGLEGGYLDGG